MSTVALTILTTTFNRAHLLEKCFQSLLDQTCKDFEWLIVDDGSTDSTSTTVEELKCKSDFNIVYVKKENGGKHTALNFSHPYIKGKYTFFLDDDDVLTSDAVEIILTEWEKHKDNPQIWCLSFSRSKDTVVPLVPLSGNEIISNAIDYRINENRPGDCAEVVKSDLFIQYYFPEFENEKFLGEDCMWITLAHKYNTVYYKKIIYICNYIDGGLTKSGRIMRLKNPRGGMYRCNLYLNHRFSHLQKIKNAILYDCYALADKSFKKSIMTSNNPLLCIVVVPLGWLFYQKWR